MIEHDEQAIAQEILDAMPDEQPPRGNKPNWGNATTRIRAYVQAARMGMNVHTGCRNCDADVWDNLIVTADGGAND